MIRQILPAALLLLAACASTGSGARGPVSALPADSTRVYHASEVATRPRLINQNDVARALAMNYARTAQSALDEAVVMLRLVVDTQGMPAAVTVVSSSNPVFNRAAINVIQSMRFTPAVHNGARVGVRMELPVNFRASQ